MAMTKGKCQNVIYRISSIITSLRLFVACYGLYFMHTRNAHTLIHSLIKLNTRDSFEF